MRAIVTGSSGFVGSALRAALGPGCVALRLGARDWAHGLEQAPLEGAVVFHLAARVHDPRDRDEAAFRHDNAEKTRQLALAAARRGARRIVFLSTLKVHGEETRGRPFGPDDAPAPEDAYARSKLEGEQALREAAGETPWVIVRSPLVLGAAAPANLAQLTRIADTAVPLPFAAIANRRSFIHREDLARLLLTCGSHPAASGRVFMAGHPEPMSTPALVGALRRALGRPPRMWAVAPRTLELAAAAVGTGASMRRLTRSLEADVSATQRELGWSASKGLEESAAEMARAWRGARP